MKTYSKYENNQELCWYNSSNVLFSKCYNKHGNEVVLKLVFKKGITYLYRDVDVADYVGFRDSQSNGSGFTKYIKKYKPTRIQDTDLDQLEKLKVNLIGEDSTLQESKVSDVIYTIDYVEDSGEFILKREDKQIFHGFEGKVSIVELFTAMGVKSILNEVQEITIDSDEEEDKITI